MLKKEKCYTVIMVLLLIASFSGVTVLSANASASKVEVIVGFVGQPDVQLIRQHGGDVRRVYSIIPALYASLPEWAVEVLKKSPKVAYIHENGIVEAVAQTTPWGVSHINAPQAWNQSKGRNVEVAVLDTGVDTGHEDLMVYGGVSFVTGTPSYKDDNGHGTHVAGIIAALDNTIGVVGVAPEAKLYAVKVLNSQGSGSLDQVIMGIQWAVNNSMNVISMSLSTKSDYQALHDACDAAYSKGLLLVAAAGNDGKRFGLLDTVRYPAKYSSVIAVAATDESDKRASFSSAGPAVDIAAPGVDIYSTYIGNSYTTLSGTSMATPHVSGVAALVWAKNPSLTNVEVRQILDDTADYLGNEKWYGNGLVDAYAAVTAAATQTVLVIEVTQGKRPIT
jgi:subtilisin family serine protease